MLRRAYVGMKDFGVEGRDVRVRALWGECAGDIKAKDVGVAFLDPATEHHFRECHLLRGVQGLCRSISVVQGPEREHPFLWDRQVRVVYILNWQRIACRRIRRVWDSSCGVRNIWLRVKDCEMFSQQERIMPKAGHYCSTYKVLGRGSHNRNAQRGSLVMHQSYHSSGQSPFLSRTYCVAWLKC